MNRRRQTGAGRPSGAHASRSRPAKRSQASSRPSRRRSSDFAIVERTPNSLASPPRADTTSDLPGPFRVLIAVHRPRFRGRAERAAALIGWEVTSLLNKQDPVGQVAKPPRPPDILVISGDFGRQRDYAIFRAVQSWRNQGMRIVGLVDDCETPPEGYPDSSPERLCDVCLTPPYKMADLRTQFARLYEEMRGETAPPPRSAHLDTSEDIDTE